MTLMSLLLLAITAAAWIGILLAARYHKISTLQLFCNIAEGVYENGEITQFSDVALNIRYLLVKVGSVEGNCTITGVGDVPIGVAGDSNLIRGNTDLTYPINVGLLGASAGRVRKVAINTTVNRGDYLVPGLTGYAKSLPTSGGGTTVIIGRASIKAGVAGDILPFDPCLPYLVTIAT